MTKLLLATRSAGKLRELAPMLAAAGLHGIDLAAAGVPESPHEDAIEQHATFEANALAKARHFYSITGLPTLADDSGLCVDALGGRPGVHSRRWSGRPDLVGGALDDANNAKLLAALDGAAARDAAYVCVVAYVDDERELVARGETRGRILHEPRGDAGFGYDPYFWSTDLARGFGEVTPQEKSRVSHRGRAMASVLRLITGTS